MRPATLPTQGSGSPTQSVFVYEDTGLLQQGLQEPQHRQAVLLSVPALHPLE